MSRRIRRFGKIGLLAVSLLLTACEGWNLGWPDLSGSSGSGSGFRDTFAQAGGADEYLVEFSCGSNGVQDPVVPGEYGTMVNIYNPNSSGTILVTMRVSLSFPDRYPDAGTRSSSTPSTNLAFQRALGVDCETIRSEFNDVPSSGFISGVLVLGSPTRVDVTATYTAGGANSVDSIHVERIQAR